MPLTNLIPGRIKSRWQHAVQRRRENWWMAHAGEARSFSYRLQPGVRIHLHLDSELSRLIYCRHFEAAEREFLNNFLRPGDTFVDVGANIGLFTLIAVNRVGAEGQVIAFEPTPETFARLVQNVQSSGCRNISCEQLALSDKSGKIEMTKSIDGFDAWNSLASPKKGQALVKGTIQATTWTDYAQEHGLAGRVTMMKIDVEGWETWVLEGGRKFLSRADAPLLQVEFTDGAARAAGSSCRELYERLTGMGYGIFAFDVENRQLIPDALRKEYPNANLYAAKDVQFANARLSGKK